MFHDSGYLIRVGAKLFTTEVIFSTSMWLRSDVLGKGSATRLAGNVRILNFEEVMEQYPGDIIWIPIKEKLSAQKEAEVKSFIKREHERNPPYDFRDYVVTGIARTPILNLFAPNPAEDLNEYFCSEYTSLLMEVCGIFPEAVNHSIMTPVDIAAQRTAFKELLMIKDAGVGDNFNPTEPNDWKNAIDPEATRVSVVTVTVVSD